MKGNRRHSLARRAAGLFLILGMVLPSFSRADLISYWPLDETTGEVAADRVGGNDATWQNPGNNLTWVTGQIGGAADFADDGGDSYFLLDLPQLIGARAASFSLWINNRDQSSADYNGLFMSRNFNGNNESWGLAIENDGTNYHFDSRVNRPGWDSAAGSLPADDEWKHLVMVWDGNAGKHLQYINGVQTNSNAGTFAGPIAGPDSIWHIGYDNCCGNIRDFDGLIDDVAVWNAALTPEEVEEIYQNGLNGIGVAGDGPPKLRLTVETSGDDQLTFTWNSEAGRVYDLLSDTGLSSDPADWEVWDGNQNIEATPPENTLVIARPADPRRFFVIEGFPAPPVSVFSDNFESGQGNWTTGGDPGSDPFTNWEFGSPSLVGPASANSGANCFATNLSADYADDADIWLSSPAIDLAAAGGATLNFSHYVDIEEGFDSGQIRLLDADAALAELAILQMTIDGNNPTGWEPFSKALPAAALGQNVVIEFRFNSDDFSDRTQGGWYIDDFEVTVP